MYTANSKRIDSVETLRELPYSEAMKNNLEEIQVVVRDNRTEKALREALQHLSLQRRHRGDAELAHLIELMPALREQLRPLDRHKPPTS